MKKMCGTWLGVYAVVALVTGLIAYRRMPDPAVAWPAAIFGGGIAWMAVLYFAGIHMKIAKAKMIHRGLSGATPNDGEKIAAIGRISAVGGETLTSPLTRTPCVAYKYDIRQGTGTDDFTWYEGFALTPSVIQGRMRTIKLLAWGDLSLPWEFIPADTVYANADAYIKNTRFEPPTAVNIRATINKSIEIYKDDKGSVRWDQVGVRTESPNLQVSAYRERLLEPGDTVCVIGRYSAARGGIVPSDSPFADPVSIESGEEESFVRSANRGAIGYTIGALIFSAIYLAAVIVFHAKIPLEAGEQRDKSMVASWPEIRFEHMLDQMGMLSSEKLAILLPGGAANGRIKAAGRDVVATRATLRRDGDDRQIRIDDGALALTIDGQGKARRLTIFGREIPPADVKVEIRGESQNAVLGRVSAFSDEAACRVTFYATP